MPSFADLKAKAAKTTSSGVEKLQNMKDRNTSVPMKKTNWDPYNGAPPPPPPPPRSLVNQRTKPEPPVFLPPPSRTASGASSPSPSLPARSTSSVSPGPAPPLPVRAPSSRPPALPQRNNAPQEPVLPPPSRTGVSVSRNVGPTPAGPPPPVARSTRPDLETRESFSAAAGHDQAEIDWTNLSEEDKEAFFSWLDEYFSNRLKITITPRNGNQRSSESKGIFGGPPPPLQVSTKPTSWTRPVVGNARPNFVLSHPPAAINDCAAADLAEFFKPNTSWDDDWYARSGIPPPLDGNSENRYATSWHSRGSVKTTQIGVMFSDLSVFWGAVTFAMDDTTNRSTLKREAWYLPRPKALDRDKLVEASETYGETIASFAESFLGTGQCCARGECWDLASEALKYFDGYDYVPKPVPSISRTHGHLIYEGKATMTTAMTATTNKGGGRETVGRWRGGDDRVRRGDIVEWRRARIATVGAPPGSYSKLGDPDHTAVIVNEVRPAAVVVNVRDGANIKPSELGTLTVVEQSSGQPPVRKEYDLLGMEEGEIWIYRPVGLKCYLGISDLAPSIPDKHLSGLCTV